MAKIYHLNEIERGRYSWHGIAHFREGNKEFRDIDIESASGVDLRDLLDVSSAWIKKEHPQFPHVIIASAKARGVPEDAVRVNGNGRAIFLNIGEYERGEKKNSRLEFVYE